MKLNKGFSLVAAIVAVSIMGGAAVVMMKLMDNFNDGRVRSESVQDQLDLRNEINMILNNSKYCKISLAFDENGDPASFKKSKIDGDEPDEGLDLELWYSDTKGENRTKKKFSALDPNFKKYGRLEIKSIKLLMNTDPGTGDYTESGSDMGEVHVKFVKKISVKSTRDMKLKFPVRVSYSVDGGGKATIEGCKGASGGGGGSGGTVLVVHSQTTSVPDCPDGYNAVENWDGYSLLAYATDSNTQSLDLGSTGSCLKTFRRLIHIVSYVDENWTKTGSGGSLWLTADNVGSSTPNDWDVPTPEKNHISRCSICIGPSPVFVLHSQSTSVPNCPSGFQQLWDGYSFVAGSNYKIDGTDPGAWFSSPGSCLRDKKQHLFMECNGSECQVAGNDDSAAYLSTTSTIGDPLDRNKIGRCAVCGPE